MGDFICSNEWHTTGRHLNRLVNIPSWSSADAACDAKSPHVSLSSGLMRLGKWMILAAYPEQVGAAARR